jgi:hypothetical protein
MTFERPGPVVDATINSLVAVDGPLASAATELPTLPTDFPTYLSSKTAWTGSQFTSLAEYVERLGESDVLEIEQALQHFKTLGLDGDMASPDTFPLPNLGPRLRKVRSEIYEGKGFGVIRGIDAQKYPVEDLTTIYLGVQSYISNLQGRQDKKGNMLVHIVADNSSKIKAEHHRHSTAPITFHNEEAGDVVSWLTRSTAASGGRCIIASGHTVYNVLAAVRPDMIRTLSRADWPFGIPRFQCRPVMFHHDGRIIMNFGRTALLGSASNPRPANFPELTARQMEALDAIEIIAQATQLEITTQAGDMHFINNLFVLHRREGFVNGQSLEQRRHLVRMRIRDDELGWSIPSELADEWHRAFSAKGSRVWHLEPMPDGFFPLRKFAN